jgi:starvation-inducible DNA-binding protein
MQLPNSEPANRQEVFMTRSPDKQHEKLATGLTGLLADTYLLYHSTQACHWNVEGPQFHSLHEMFEQQYGELAEAVDRIAERVRALGFYTPGTLPQLVELSRIRQPAGLRATAEMLRHLVEAHRQVIHRANELRGVADEALDEATADLLVERMRAHEKALWMLRSQAGGGSAELAEVEQMVNSA